MRPLGIITLIEPLIWPGFYAHSNFEGRARRGHWHFLLFDHPPSPLVMASASRCLTIARACTQIGGPLSGANRKIFAHFETYRF
jgi:hypothetical protein